jgi:hypothetical protein
MKQAYTTVIMRGSTLELVKLMESIIDDYVAQGFTLSVRQIYYQLVARDIVENTERSYKRVASILNDARLAGLIDWNHIEDRNRDIEIRARWSSGSHILRSVADQFHMDLWENQPQRVFVIVEKAALAGVLGGICGEYDVPLLAARGYPSVSIMRELALEHIQPAIALGQAVTVLHLGDHDPSGIDMTRDLTDRLAMFLPFGGAGCELKRIALTMEQINTYNPPPNPAKTTDSRFASYLKEYGDESWELDALEPSQLVELVTGHISERIKYSAWDAKKRHIAKVKSKLLDVARDFKTDEGDM